MAIEYVWKIENMIRTNDSDKGVVRVDYMIEGIEDGDMENTAYGNAQINFVPNPSDSSFIPFNQLTEEQVIDWIKEELGDEEIQKIEAQILKLIQVRKNPPTIAELPWV